MRIVIDIVDDMYKYLVSDNDELLADGEALTLSELCEVIEDVLSDIIED